MRHTRTLNQSNSNWTQHNHLKFFEQCAALTAGAALFVHLNEIADDKTFTANNDAEANRSEAARIDRNFGSAGTLLSSWRDAQENPM